MQLQKENFEEHLKAYKIIFGELQDQSIQVKTFSPSGTKYITIGDTIVVEQNKQKNSQWALKAKQGKKIAWVIRKKDNKYLARIVDGNLETL